MEAQMTIFDFLPKAHRDTDPESSREAENSINRWRRPRNLNFVYNALLHCYRPVTSRELWTHYHERFEKVGIDKYEVARRLSDLKKTSRVISCGLRMCEVAGKRLETYRAIYGTD